MAKPKSSYKKNLLKSLRDWPKSFWQRSKFNKLATVLILIVFICTLIMYVIGEYYILSNNGRQTQFGVSFIPDYAQSLGLDPKQTFDALLNINVKEFRLTSYWSDIEPNPGQYDFSMLDWEFSQAEAHHAKIILTLGLRQPRWPECHPPNWINTAEPTSEWQPQLEQFMQTVVNRYKSSPSLEYYQLENEYFLQGFGTCNNFSRSRFISEDNLVKSLDPHHEIIIGRSNNFLGMPVGKPQPNIIGVSVYQRVWDANLTHRYLEYPWPAWYYSFMAESQKIFTGHDMIITEMQAEAWPPNGKSITQISLNEQNKSMNPKILKQRFDYSKATHVSHVEMWGAEYWYYRAVKLHDPSLWNVAKQEFQAN
jgi:hypothetical protein